MSKKTSFWSVVAFTTVTVICLAIIVNIVDFKIVKAATESISLIREDCTGYSNCYTSLKLWENDFGGLPNGDLITQDKIAIAKIDGPWTSPDTSSLLIDGWTTGPNNYIKIYTTPEARHTGVWDNTKYVLSPSDTVVSPIEIREEYVRIDGLQVNHTRGYNGASIVFLLALNKNGVSGGVPAEIQISKNIIRQGDNTTHTSSVSISAQYAPYVNNFILKAWNNVIYSTVTSTGRGIEISDADWTGYIYNNTVYNIANCYRQVVGTFVSKNNIAQGCATTGYSGTFDAISDYNVSNLADAPGGNSKNSATVSFTNLTNYDFSLLSSDVVAQDTGIDLSSDSNISFSVDNRGYGRTAPWDIGAMEISTDIPPPPADTTPPSISGGSPSGTLAAGTTSATVSVSTNEDATCKYSATAGTAYASMANTFSTTGSTSHSSTISNLSDSTNYSYYVRCQDASSNTNTADYIINFAVNDPAAPAPVTTASPAGGSFTTEQTVTLDTSDTTATIYYTLDGSTPTTASSVYSSPITISSTKTLKFFAKNTDNVNEAVKTETYTITITPATEVITLIREDCTGYSNCFTSLKKWEDNYGGINFGLCTPGDLKCANKIAIAKIEGPWANPDTDTQTGDSGVSINGWVTSPKNYIKIYTSGESRHNGVWSDTAYRLSPGKAELRALDINEDYVQIDGLQIDSTRPYFGSLTGINLAPSKDKLQTSEIYISNNIIRHGANTAGSGSSAIKMDYVQNQHNFVSKIWNNIAYSTIPGGIVGIFVKDADWTSYVYNNTVYNYTTCYSLGYGTFISKNNIAQDCATGYSGTFDGASTNNISSVSDAPGSNSKNGVTVNFVDVVNYNFGLLGTDTVARNAGANLSTDTNLKFPDDIRGYGRYAPWDIGASEDSLLPPPDIIPPVITESAPSGVFPSNTSSTNLSVTTDEDSTCKYGTIANTLYDNIVNSFSGLGTLIHSATISNLLSGSSYQFFVRCKDTSNNANTIDDIISFSLSPIDTQTPSIPTGLTSSAYSSSQINLSWSPSTDNIGIQGYKIYRNSVNIGTSLGTSYSDINLASNTTYSYSVSAYDANNNESAKSVSVSETTFPSGFNAMEVWAIGDSDKIQRNGNIGNPSYMSANPNYKTDNDVWNGSSINLKGAKNETVAFQAIIEAPGAGLQGVSASMSNLVSGSNIIDSSNAEFFKELYIKTTAKSDGNSNNLPPDYYPDALMPLNPDPTWLMPGYTLDDFSNFDVVNGYNQPVWVDITIPKGTPAGIYSGNLIITASNSATKNVPINLTVWNFSIPDERSFDVFWDLYPEGVIKMFNVKNTDGVTEYNAWRTRAPDPNDDFWDLAQKFYQMAHNHRAQLIPRYPMTPFYNGTSDSNGYVTSLDWTNFDATYGKILDGTLFADGVGNTLWRVMYSGTKNGIYFPEANAFYAGDSEFLATLEDEIDDEKYYLQCWQGQGCFTVDDAYKQACIACHDCDNTSLLVSTIAERQQWTRDRKQKDKNKTSSWASLVAQHFLSKGWFNNKKVFAYIADEPGIKWSQVIEDASQLIKTGSGGKIKTLITRYAFPISPLYLSTWNTIKKSGPDMWTRTHATDGQKHWQFPNWTGNSKSKIDIFAGAWFSAESNPYVKETIEYAKSQGADAWFYNGAEPWIGTPIIDTDGLSYRTQSWIAYKYGVDAYYAWNVVSWKKQTNNYADKSMVYIDPNAGDNTTATRNGNGYLYYPGYQKGLNGPVSSFRMKTQRRGLYDHEYMTKLEKLGDANFAHSEVDKVITKALHVYLPPTTLTVDAPAGSMEITLADASNIYGVGTLLNADNDDALPVKLINSNGEDELVLTISKSGNVVTLYEPLHFSYKAGDTVNLMAEPNSWMSNHADEYDLVGKWSRDPRDWENARVAIANKIVCLQAGTCGIIDNKAPAAITNLSATSASDGTVTLSWTAPGDDGNNLGTWASSYTIKYSKTAIDTGNWNSITTTVTAPTPQTQGSLESLVLSNLTPLTTYYFGIKSTDEAGNESSLSNTPSATTQVLVGDTNPPSDVDLVKTKVTKDEVILTWAESTDDVGVIGYEMRYKMGGTLVDDTNWDLATEVNGEPAPGQTLEMIFNQANGNQLIPGVNYSFGVKAYDLAGNYSSVSNINNIANVPVPQDSTPPSTIDDLSITDITETSVKLNWTSPGNDGNIGTAGKYIIATSSVSITSDNWDSLGKIDGVADGAPTPKIAGETQSKVIVGLKPNTSYYFAIRAEDMALNMSAISNVETATTEKIYTVSGGGTSGGGGGCSACGSNTDTTPPSIPSKFKSKVDDIYINLTWENPDDNDFIGIVIVRKEGSEPTSISDGDKIYTGEEESFTDKSVLKKETDYYYAIYSFDHKPNYSQPETIIVNISKNKITAISDDTTEVIETDTQPQNNLPEKQVTYNFPLLTGPFSVGMENDQVTLLQQMLATDATLYPQGLITGYYGSLTVKAVQKFQELYKIVTSGDPSSTGYGLAGPTTRKKMNEVFRHATGSSVPQEDLSSEDLAKEELMALIREQIRQLQEMLIQLLSQMAEMLMGQLTQ